jgi:excinuclease ABC subunit C
MDDTVFNELKAKASMLPKEPGVYQFLDSTGKIIYIGKAKVLQHRVISYFLAPDSKNIKLRVMVKKIADIHHIVTASESDALLLENNMIKKYQPRYNILLKDDKSFPWICVSSENFPRIFLTRQKKDKNARYFGPYTSVGIAKTLL